MQEIPERSFSSLLTGNPKMRRIERRRITKDQTPSCLFFLLPMFEVYALDRGKVSSGINTPFYRRDSSKAAKNKEDLDLVSLSHQNVYFLLFILC